MQSAEFRMRNSECRLQRVRRHAATAAFCILHSAFLFSLTACGTKARAEAIPEGPPLAVPTAPAHQIAVEQVAEAPEPEPPPAPEPAAPPKPAVTAPPPRPRAETPPSQPAASPQPETPTVRVAPAPTTTSAADERKVRELMGKASTDLARVDYKRLTNEGKAQYDQSKRYSDDAAKAIKERNFVYALTLAEKAADIAAELAR
jgi:outer membrane biosynthesis protein TonB